MYPQDTSMRKRDLAKVVGTLSGHLVRAPCPAGTLSASISRQNGFDHGRFRMLFRGHGFCSNLRLPTAYGWLSSRPFRRSINQRSKDAEIRDAC